MQRFFAMTLALAFVAATVVIAGFEPQLTEHWAIEVVWFVAIVTASILLGEVARLVRLNRVLGYVAAGLLVGPFSYLIPGVSLLPATADSFFARDATIFFTGAIALTGLTVGIKIRFSGRELFRGPILLSTMALIAAVVLPSSLVILLLAPELVGDSMAIAIAVGLVSAMSGISLMHAMDVEHHVHSNLADLFNQLATFRDIIILLCLGVIAVALLIPTTQDVGTAIWSSVLPVLVALGLGFLSAGVIGLGIRWLPGQTLYLVLGLAVSAALTTFEAPFLVFMGSITCGFALANLFDGASRLSESLDRQSFLHLSLSILFLITFLDLEHPAGHWALVLLLAGLRATGLVISGLMLRNKVEVGEELLGGFIASNIGQALTGFLVIDWFGKVLGYQLLAWYSPYLLVLLVGGSLTHSFYHRKWLSTREVDEIAPPGRPTEVPRSFGLTATDMSLGSLVRPAEKVRLRLIKALEGFHLDHIVLRKEELSRWVEEVGYLLEERLEDTRRELSYTSEAEVPAVLRRSMQDFDRRFAQFLEASAVDYEVEEHFLASFSIFTDQLERAIQDVPAHVRAPYIDASYDPDIHDGKWLRFRKFCVRALGLTRGTRVVPMYDLARDELVLGISSHLRGVLHEAHRQRIAFLGQVCEIFKRVRDRHLETLVWLDDTATVEVDLDAQEEDDLQRFDRRLAGEMENEPEATEVSDQDSISDRVVHIIENWGLLALDVREDLDELTLRHHEKCDALAALLARAVEYGWRYFQTALPRAGTFLTPSRNLLDPAKVEAYQLLRKEMKTLPDRFRRMSSAWKERHRLQMFSHDVNAQLRGMLDLLVERVDSELRSRLGYYPAELYERCGDVRGMLSQTFASQPTVADLVEAFDQIRMGFQSFVFDRALPDLHELRDAQRYTHDVRSFVLDVESRISRHTNPLVIGNEPIHSDESARILEIEPVKIPLDLVGEEFIVRPIAQGFTEIESEIRSATDHVSESLQEAVRVVGYVLENVARDISDASHPQAIEALESQTLEGISKAESIVGEALEHAMRQMDQIDEHIIAIVVEPFRQFRDFFDQDTATLKEIVNRLRSREATQATRQRVESRLQGLEHRLRSKLSYPLLRLRRTLDRFVPQRLDPEDVANSYRETSLEDDGQYPDEIFGLLSPTADSPVELWVPRPRAQEEFDTAFAQWRQGARTSILVHGRFGSGRQSLIRRMLARSIDTTLLRLRLRQRPSSVKELVGSLSQLFGLPHQESVDALLAALEKNKDRRAVMVGGLEEIFLRSARQAGVLDALLEIIARTPPQLLWVMTAQTRNWEFFSTHFDAASAITHEIAVADMDAHTLEELLMTRLSLAPIPLAFVGPRGYLLLQRCASDRNVMRRWQTLLKEILSESHGNPYEALFLMLGSLTPASEDNLLVIESPRLPNFHPLQELGDLELLTLAHFILHNRLRFEEFEVVSRLDSGRARKILRGLEKSGVLEEREEGWHVRPILRNPLTELLVRKRML